MADALTLKVAERLCASSDDEDADSVEKEEYETCDRVIAFSGGGP